MDKGTKNSGIPVFGEIVKLLDKQKINILAEEMGDVINNHRAKH